MSSSGAGSSGIRNPPGLAFDRFKQGFSADRFLAELLKSAVNSKRPTGSIADVSAALTQTRFSLDRVRKLLKSFDRADEELETLNNQVAARVNELQTNVEEHEREYLSEVDALERQMDAVRSVLKEVDEHSGRVSQTATRIGDRLQTADTLRQRAADSATLIEHLQCFSLLPTDDHSFVQLPKFFCETSTLREAAASARQLLALAKDAHSAKLRTLLVTRADTPRLTTPLGGEGGGVGSVEYAIQRLEGYSSWLENRVLSRFDDAMERHELAVMAECAHIMAQFDRERTVLQRYIASRPIILEAAMSPPLGLEERRSLPPEEALQPIQQLFEELHEAVVKEAVTVRTVFPSPKLALELFLQVLCEQRLQVALEQLLRPPGQKARAQELRQHLRLLAAAYQRTVDLVSALEDAAAGLVDLAHVADDLFMPFMHDYPMPELTWMQLSFHAKADSVESPDLDPAFVRELLSWNMEACSRCTVLCAPSQLPRAVRMLFHSSSHASANTGCLLEQVAMHLITGLQHSVDLCQSGHIQALASMGTGVINKALCQKLAGSYVHDHVRRVLQAVAGAALMMGQLQEHYNSVVLPHAVSSISEHAACNTGLAALLRAVEEHALAALHAALNHFFGQVERVLQTEQRRSDFAPVDDSLAAIDRPSVACVLVSCMVAELEGAARESLHGANLAALLTEAGFRLYGVLLAHMQRFVFSPLGALKWKKDVAEYSLLLQDADMAGVNQKLAELAALVNVLIVAPESLLGLVNGTLRMAHRDVLRFIQLRSDFKSARVDGKTLQQIFTEDAPADSKATSAKK